VIVDMLTDQIHTAGSRNQPGFAAWPEGLIEYLARVWRS